MSYNMREIKFRAWNKEKKCIVEVQEIKFASKQHKEDRVFVGFGEEINKSYLMQYTGLKDKNGVEIYEGDIVEDSGTKFEVVYLGGFYGMRHELHSINLDYMLATRNSDSEVIGNIYENKELLSWR